MVIWWGDFGAAVGAVGVGGDEWWENVRVICEVQVRGRRVRGRRVRGRRGEARRAVVVGGRKGGQAKQVGQGMGGQWAVFLVG